MTADGEILHYYVTVSSQECLWNLELFLAQGRLGCTGDGSDRTGLT